MDDILQTLTYRANPLYEAVPFNRLEKAERKALAPWQATSDSFGILIPKKESNLPTTAISRDTALLFFTMRIPGRLPDYLQTMPTVQQNKAISSLILDHVLEIKGPQGFVGGPEALTIIGQESQMADSRLNGLSYDALRYGQELTHIDLQTLAYKLYFYNRLPATRKWCDLLPDQTAVLRYLNVHPGGSNYLPVCKFWEIVKGNEAWIPFKARQAQSRPYPKAYKLYLSPKPEVLPDIIPIVAEILGTCGAVQFKIGANCFGLLRPDKFVAYFTDKQQLFQASSTLNTKLSGVAVHGVPFTAETAADGLISWGIDPQGVNDIEGRSWRQWITNQLAASLLQAKNHTGGTLEPWRFALERLNQEGVDTASFIPDASWTGGHEL